MIIKLSNGRQLRGDYVLNAILRNDAVPVPATFEAELRLDDADRKLVKEGGQVTVENDLFTIIKTSESVDPQQQNRKNLNTIKIIAGLDACLQVSFVTNKAIIKENAHLGQIYRACGAKVFSISDDFNVPRFTCFNGDVPSFHIARVLQESGAILRWKKGRLQYIRLQDLFNQKPVTTIPDVESDDIKSGYLERNAVPTFYSTDETGAFSMGSTKKTRTMMYTPLKNQQDLMSMTKVLIKRKVSRIPFNLGVCAGDIVQVVGKGKLAVITAAHVFTANEQYSRLWLSELGD